MLRVGSLGFEGFVGYSCGHLGCGGRCTARSFGCGFTEDLTAGEAVLSDITLLEIAMLAKKGRLELSVSAEEYLRVIQRNYPLLTITSEIASMAVDLDLPQGDPFDRIIVASALHHNRRSSPAIKIFLRADWCGPCGRWFFWFRIQSCVALTRRKALDREAILDDQIPHFYSPINLATTGSMDSDQS